MLTSSKNLAAAEARIGELTEQLRISGEAKTAAEAKLATFEGTGEGSLAALRTRADTAEASVLDLTGKLAKAGTDLAAATGQIEAYQAAIGTGEEALFAFAHPEGGKPSLALTATGEARFVNAKVQRTLAAGGHQPLPLVDSPAPAPGATQTTPTGEGRTKTTWDRSF